MTSDTKNGGGQIELKRKPRKKEEEKGEERVSERRSVVRLKEAASGFIRASFPPLFASRHVAKTIKMPQEQISVRRLSTKSRFALPFLRPSWLSHGEGGVNNAFPPSRLPPSLRRLCPRPRRPIGRVGRGVKNAASSANQVAARSLAPLACLEVPGLTPAPRRRVAAPIRPSCRACPRTRALSLIFLQVY